MQLTVPCFRNKKYSCSDILEKQKIYIMLIIIIFVQFPLYSQVITDTEVQKQLRQWGVESSDTIENAKTIIIEFGKIKPQGGISISLPILEFINKDQIILLRGASGYITSKGTIVIEAQLLYISAVVISIKGNKYLIVGESLKDIVNYLLGY